MWGSRPAQLQMPCHNRWRPLRELFAHLLRALIGSVLAVVAWVGRQLDYARPFRPEAHYQQVQLHQGLGFVTLCAPSARRRTTCRCSCPGVEGLCDVVY
jgi:hypothetical protein